MSFLKYFEQGNEDKKENPNSPKYLVMIIIFLGSIMIGIYRIEAFDPWDDICAYLASEKEKIQEEGNALLPLSDIDRMQEYHNCNERRTTIKKKSEKNIVYRLVMPKNIKEWVNET